MKCERGKGIWHCCGLFATNPNKQRVTVDTTLACRQQMDAMWVSVQTCEAFKGNQQLVALRLDEGKAALQGSRLAAVALSPLLQGHVLCCLALKPAQ